MKMHLLIDSATCLNGEACRSSLGLHMDYLTFTARDVTCKSCKRTKEFTNRVKLQAIGSDGEYLYPLSECY